MHRPVCVKCEIEYRCSRNGVEVVDFNANGEYAYWNADEFECPGCQTRIIVGFGDSPMARHFEEGFKEEVANIAPDLRRNNYESAAERRAATEAVAQAPAS